MNQQDKNQILAKAFIKVGDFKTAEELIGIQQDTLHIPILDQFITRNSQCLAIKEKIKILRGFPKISVLISGATGTGKELLARALARTEESFYPVNCAGLTAELFCSEVFGNVPGSYTGARGAKGILEEAGDGVVFFDEIGELPKEVQSKLLRTIQFNKVRPVGAVRDKDISCRFVFATHQNIKESLREDFYYRIAQVVLEVPPLAHREFEDTILIANRLMGYPISEGRIQQLQFFYDSQCPGNIRGLQNMILNWKLFEDKVPVL